ncbi:hypothetical protein [Actinomycetospora straminea]|uniref:Uncharacterized protein n=1 Tax=Actinomycetospora straminea TaxID=663607 RepID=A0ABP9EQL3_9PSEU|nr:hypothetical protein [Actinomycetospora straminea]MDD7933721.1 hypothetical protein [Actinomycetospora straminea]
MSTADFVRALGRHLKRRIGLYFEIATAVVGLVVFVAQFFRDFSQNTLVGITIGLLALLAITGLIERITRLEDLDTKITAVHQAVSTGSLARSVADAVTRDAELETRLAEVGVADASPNLARTSWTEEVRRATSVRVLASWTGPGNDLAEALKGAVTKGATARLLLLDPDSDHAAQRSAELGKASSFATDQIRAELQNWDWNCETSPALEAVETRLYDGNPVVYLIGYDDVILLRLFWRKQMAVHAPFLRLRLTPEEPGGRTLAQLADRHFEDLWQNSRPRIRQHAVGQQ